MFRSSTRISVNAIRAAVVAGAAITFTASAVIAAEDVTSDQILRALAPKKPLTRGLSMAPPAEPAVNAAEGKFMDSLRNRSTRSLSLGEREQIATIAQTKPAIDLEINFDYNSANISKRSMQSVQALGKALSSPDLKGSTFVVAGHTDAVGGEEYNQELSERRRCRFDQALSGRSLRHRRRRPRDSRLWQDQAEEWSRADRSDQSPRSGRKYGQ